MLSKIVATVPLGIGAIPILSRAARARSTHPDLKIQLNSLIIN
jgi:hypothetical protein